MIKKLKKRFLLIAMASVIAVLTILMSAINLRSYFHVLGEADLILDLLAENGGRFPGPNPDRIQDGWEEGVFPGPGGSFPRPQDGFFASDETDTTFQNGSSSSNSTGEDSLRTKPLFPKNTSYTVHEWITEEGTLSVRKGDAAVKRRRVQHGRDMLCRCANRHRSQRLHLLRAWHRPEKARACRLQ